MTKNRISLLIERNWRAWQLGCSFGRSATFIVPKVISIAGASRPLSVPDDHGTKNAFIDVLLDDCYGLGGFPQSTKVIVDIGAHVGLFSLAARDRFPRAMIHAYEPNPATWPHLESNVQPLGVVVHREAVGHTRGDGVLVPLEDSVHARIQVQPGGSIRCMDFSTVLHRVGGRIDLLKLDCEGGEWAILSVTAAWSHIRHLTMEFHLWAGYSIDDLRHRLQELGFEISHLEYSGPDFGTLVAHNKQLVAE